MKNLTLLLVIVFAVTSAFKGDKRKSVDFDAEKISKLLRDNETVVSSNLPPHLTQSFKHTWTQINFEDENTLILCSNQSVKEGICRSQSYWFLADNVLKSTRHNSCEGQVQIEEESSYSYAVHDDKKTHLTLSDEAGTIVKDYKVTKLEKVEYDNGLSGYEITLIKQ